MAEIFQPSDKIKLIFILPEADLEGGVRGVRPPPQKIFFRKTYVIRYTTLLKQFNKQLFHEWLTRDL